MVNSSLAVVAAIICCSATPAAAFLGPPGIPGVAWGSGTKLSFGFNGLGTPKEDTEIDSDKAEDEKKISAGGLFQLITAGMGAPFLGDYQGVSDVSILSYLFECYVHNHMQLTYEHALLQIPNI